MNSLLGCKVGKLQSTYLGLLWGASFQMFYLLGCCGGESFQKVNVMEMPVFVYGGRLILSKSTLSRLRIYHLYMFIIPREVGTHEIGKGLTGLHMGRQFFGQETLVN